MKVKLLFLLVCSLMCSALRGQDIHFSQIHASPFMLNPAMTGIFEGSTRLIANYRNQWRSVTADYRTLMFSADTNILEFGNNQSIGLGGHFYTDVAGDLDFSTNFAGFSISSIRSFDDDHSHILAGGLQVGHISNGFDPTKIIAHDPSEAFEEGANRLSMLDVSAGILWYSKITDRQFLYLGGAIYHANEPVFTFRDQGRTAEKMPPRYVIHGGANFNLTDQVIVIPNIIFMRQGPYQQLTAGTFLRYTLNSKGREKPSAFMAGGWFRGLNLKDRLGVDALIATIRLEYANYLFTFSYDINVSSLARASYGRGGPEISVIYTFGKPQTRYKRLSGEPARKRKHRIKCPYF